ncbi:porin [Methylobacterium sp. Leaf89]|uniref:porin n=1 Tax=Methylobacterium sp. Leaf89 TaxID=1736245 RepID=UPI000AC7DA29|nr:porin [Methylobacterium sp. Leaf89]
MSAPIEFVRVCNAYGNGFFYVPGTDTCIRLSGRARFETGYQTAYSRTGSGTSSPGDLAGYRGLARINVDARTQTSYGALRAFLRLEAANRTGSPTIRSSTVERIGFAYNATGQDQAGRVQQFMNTDKAFIQFAGFTAGRASSFYDFYAHDFEFIAATMSSDVSSTNLAAYTTKLGGSGFSATVSMEDPTFRRTPLFTAANAPGTTIAASPLFIGFATDGTPTGVGFIDVVQRNRMPDFVGVLRYDAGWGSAQLSAAVHELNYGNPVAGAFAGTSLGAAVTAANSVAGPGLATAYGWAVQGGVKVNTPFIAPGDVLYLQASYGEGAGMYTGFSSYTGSYAGNTSAIQGSAFNQYFNDAVLNPFSNRLELSTTFTAVASYLHYWTPEVRSAVFGSYGELNFAVGSRMRQGAYYGVTGAGPGVPGTRFFEVSQVLRDNYRFVVGGSLVWSPLRDLDIGVETMYTQYGVSSGRVLDLSRFPAQSAAFVNNPANAIQTKTSEDTVQVRARVQRDF